MTQAASEQEVLLDKMAVRIRQYGLAIPAVVALQIGHPLTFLSGQLLWGGQPALSLFLPTQKIRQVAQSLEDPAAVQGLLHRLEANEA